MFLSHSIVNSQTHMTADMIQVNSVSDIDATFPCAAGHDTASVSVFSCKIVSGITWFKDSYLVVRDNF